VRSGHHHEAEVAALGSGVAKRSVNQPSLKLLLVSQWCNAIDGGKATMAPAPPIGQGCDRSHTPPPSTVFTTESTTKDRLWSRTDDGNAVCFSMSEIVA